MKLRRLSISNCSRIKDLDIEVRDNLVLIGPNGSGKTTVLFCLDMLLEMDMDCLSSVISEDFVRDGSLPFSVEAVFEGLDDSERAEFAGEAGTLGPDELSVRLDVSIADGGIAISRYLTCCGIRRALTEAQCDAFGWILLQAQSYQQDELSAYQSIADDVVSEVVLNQDASIMAIDEPEAHLHPASQRSLAKILKTSTSQKILVTHSPTIAGSFRPDEIVVIRSDGIAVQPKRGFLSGNEGVLARWWIGSQLEPLTAGTVIAVEGASDRIIVNKVASALGFDLDLNDVVVIETDGCGDMKVVESIFGGGGFNIPLFVLVDEDARERTAKCFGADPADPVDLQEHGVFISNKDLEDEYVQAIGANKLWTKMKEAKAFTKGEFAQCVVGSDGSPTEHDLAEFIRTKRRGRKIPSALVATSLIDSSVAPHVKSAAAILKAAFS